MRLLTSWKATPCVVYTFRESAISTSWKVTNPFYNICWSPEPLLFRIEKFLPWSSIRCVDYNVPCAQTLQDPSWTGHHSWYLGGSNGLVERVREDYGKTMGSKTSWWRKSRFENSHHHWKKSRKLKAVEFWLATRFCHYFSVYNLNKCEFHASIRSGMLTTGKLANTVLLM